MSDDFTAIEDWAAGLLARLEPAERKRIHMRIATDLRRSQTQRITAQEDPDGAPFEQRKPKKKLRAKKGRIRRQKMFMRLRNAQYLRARATSDAITVGFYGRVGRIARVHQFGLKDRPAPGMDDVRYPARRLLGFTEEDRETIRDSLARHLAGHGL
jgi:phage virion morphogenesis protein